MAAPPSLKHFDSPIGENHVLQNFSYADAAARTAAVLVAGDIGKAARQSDTGEYRIVHSNVGPVWTAGLGPGFVTTGESAATAGSVRLPNLGTIQFRNVGGSANIVGAELDSSNRLNLGDSVISINPSTLRVGINTLAPASTFHVAGTDSDWRWVDSNSAAFQIRYSATAGASATVAFARAKGSKASPTGVVSGDQLGNIQFDGHDTVALTSSGRAYVRVNAEGTWSATDTPTSLRFATTPVGSAAAVERVVISAAGNVGVGGAPGAFKLDVLGGVSGSALETRQIHTSNTAGSDAVHWLQSGGASGGDPKILLNVSGVRTFYIGLDNSDSDKFMIGRDGNVGTNAYVTINDSGQVGIGTTAPTALFHVSGVSNNLLWSETNATVQNTRYDDTSSGGALNNSRRARGSASVPAALVGGDMISQLGAAGHTGTSFTAAVAMIRMYAEEAFTASAQGTNIRFLTTRLGATSVTEVARFTAEANFNMGAIAASFQSMVGGVFLRNAVTVPTGDPTAGGFMYAEAGALKWRGSSGTITTIAAA